MVAFVSPSGARFKVRPSNSMVAGRGTTVQESLTRFVTMDDVSKNKLQASVNVRWKKKK
jgi:hypothetical protein